MTGIRPRVVYIGGYGRSGSTLLDSILNCHPDVFGAGEVKWLFKYAITGELWEVSQAPEYATLWTGVLSRICDSLPGMTLARAAEITRRVEELQDAEVFAEYGRLWDTTFETLASVTGKSIIVDSSKSARRAIRRPFLLHDHSQCPIHAVHLVRDPRGVLWSIRRGDNKKMEAGRSARIHGGSARGLFGYLRANLLFERRLAQTAGLPWMRLRYEDLVSNLEDSLAAVGRMLQLDLSDVARRILAGEAFSGGAGVSGNRMRRAGPITLRVDNEWKQNCSISTRLLVLLARPLIQKYNYDLY